MTEMSRMHKYLVLIPICGVFFFTAAITARAATFYVAKNGSDDISCAASQNIATPKLTFASAVRCLAAGDRLYIRAGTYTEQLNISGLGKTGVAGQWLTVAGYPGERVIIRPFGPLNGYGAVRSTGDIGWVLFDNLDIDGVNLGQHEGWMIAYGAHDITINNVRIYNQFYHALYIEGNNISIQNSELRDPRTDCVSGHRYYGIYYHDGNAGLIQNNNIHRNAGGGIHVYGESGPGISNLTIRNNRIHDNNFCSTSVVGGIIVYQYSTASPITNVSIYNNLVYKNGSLPGHASGKVPGITVGSGGTGIKIWNNTVYGNDGQGIKVYGNLVKDTIIQNNISYNNALNNIENNVSGTIVDHNVTTNPLFENEGVMDFSLLSGSAAIDTGVTLSVIKTDIAGRARPIGSGHDIGAYEFGDGSANARPSPPVGLKVQ